MSDGHRQGVSEGATRFMNLPRVFPKVQAVCFWGPRRVFRGSQQRPWIPAACLGYPEQSSGLGHIRPEEGLRMPFEVACCGLLSNSYFGSLGGELGTRRLPERFPQ